MKLFWLILNWAFGVPILLAGLLIIVEVPLAGICLIAMSALLLPPIRNFVFSKTKHELPIAARSILLVTLCMGLGLISGLEQDKEEQELAIQQQQSALQQEQLATQQEQERVQRAEKLKRDLVEYFNTNRNSIIASVKNDYSAQKFELVVAQANKYQVARDKELWEINRQAKAKMAARRKAENIAREKRIKLAESQSEIDRSVNRTILGEWHPDKSTYISSVVLFSEGARVFDETTYNDGSSGVTELIESESPLGRRFDSRERIEEIHAKRASQGQDVSTRPRNSFSTPTIEGQKYLKEMLAMLDSFKDSPKFEQVGFGGDGEFKLWLDSLQVRRDDESFSLLERVAVVDLVMLGLHYVSHGDSRPEEDQRIRDQILGSGVVIDEMDDGDYWVIDGEGSLQAHDGSGLIFIAVRAAMPVVKIPSDVTYSIIREDRLRGVKRSLDIRLSRSVSESVLEAIADGLIRRDSTTYERTFILYYLPGMEVGSGAWASSHANPNLVVMIYGLTTPSPRSKPSLSAEKEYSKISCQSLIQRVIKGEDFSGKNLEVSGVALGKSGQGMVNLGTQETYNSGVFFNFITVFDMPGSVSIAEGERVSLRVLVEESYEVKTTDGSVAVLINTAWDK